MNNFIRGKMTFGELYIFVDGKLLSPEPSQKIVNHSPDGFSAGYLGSGVAQSALAILLAVVGKEKALKHYQSFKEEFLADPEYFGSDFQFGVDIKAWVASRQKP